MEYSTEYNKQLVKSINQFWSDEVKMCTNSRLVLLAVHKRVQKLYDVQQALVKGEFALAQRLTERLNTSVCSAIPLDIRCFMKSKATINLN